MTIEVHTRVGNRTAERSVQWQRQGDIRPMETFEQSRPGIKEPGRICASFPSRMALHPQAQQAPRFLVTIGSRQLCFCPQGQLNLVWCNCRWVATPCKPAMEEADCPSPVCLTKHIHPTGSWADLSAFSPLDREPQLLQWPGSPCFTTSMPGAEWSASGGSWLQQGWR